MPSLHTPEEVEAIGNVRSYEEAADVAIAILKRISCNGTVAVYQICGPISTGGRGSRELNWAFFCSAIHVAQKKQLVVFDQRPFERIIKLLSPDHTGIIYDDRILTIFYDRVLRSGYITHLLMLPDWQTSRGTRWERQTGRLCGLRLEYFPFDIAA